LFPAASHSLNALLAHYVAKSNIRTRARLGRSLAVSCIPPYAVRYLAHLMRARI
jgi:hypothetical protein